MPTVNLDFQYVVSVIIDIFSEGINRNRHVSPILRRQDRHVTDRAIVIGAGVGGLAAAIRLAARGMDVTLCERAESVGGKVREVDVGGPKIDGGPTVFTMRWVFDDLFAAAGTSLTTHVDLERADILARHAWSESERLDLYADLERSIDAIATFSSAEEAKRFKAFCDHTEAMYRTLRDPFLCAERPKGSMDMTARVGLGNVKALLDVKPFSTMWSQLTAHFLDPRLRQLFGRYATYCGSSPFQAPATLMLIAHVEQDGVWLIKGGMYRLIEALKSIAESVGVTIRTGAEVDQITVRNGRASGIQLTSGETLSADIVVANTDANAVYSGLLGGELADKKSATTPRKRSLSALVWTGMGRASGFPLSRHTVFFSRDYPDEFRRIFRNRQLPDEPTVYVCAQDRNAGLASVPDGEERLLILVNAPATGDTDSLQPQEIDQCHQRTMAQLERCGLSLTMNPERTALATPNTFHQLFPATGGALYGQATHGWDASFKRPANRTRLPGLYLAGGSVHPGPGIPMAALSGRLAAEAAMADLTSMGRFHPAAISGGTSTGSATTANTA